MTSETDAESLDVDALRTLTKSGGSWSGSEVSQAKPDNLVGVTLSGTYNVESVLGEGGMGRVYRARHTRVSSKLYAVKVLHREYGADPHVLARFQREAEAAASVAHPNVVGVYDVDRTPHGLPYLVCEYLAGKDLAEYLREHGKLDIEAAIYVALQVCAGVNAAHAQGVIHRDLKPQNVFLVADATGEVPERPVVKLLDFGLSRFLDGSNSELTRAGVIMGTPAFMAPEQARGERADHRLDVYGIGTILYTVLTARLPFNEESPQATILAVLRKSPTPIRTLEPSIPEVLGAIVERAMAKLPDERFASVAELSKALEQASASLVSTESASGSASTAADSEAATKVEAALAEPGAGRSWFDRFPRAGLALVTAFTALVASGYSTLVGFGAGALFPALRGVGHFSALVVAAAALCGLGVPGAVFWWWRFEKRGDDAASWQRRRLGRTVLAGLVTFSLGALVVRLHSALGQSSQLWLGLPLSGAKRWLGWDFVLSATAIIAALGEGLSVGIGASKWWIGRLAGGMVRGCSAVAIVVLLGWGFERSRLEALASLPADDVDGATEEVEDATAELLLEPGDGEPELAADTPEPAPLPAPATGRRATEDELRRAVDAGEAELIELAGRFPDDPAVLRALAFAFASRAGGLADTMTVLKQLFSVEPNTVTDPDLRYFVARAAEAPGQTAELAFDVLENSMGSAGPDLLYELLLRSKSAERALLVLRKPPLRDKFSPELAIAFDLRTAEGCAARLPLLKRASLEGDERSIIVLASLSSGTRRGCGKWKRQPCKPACPDEAAAFRQAIKGISARLNESRR